MDDFDGYDATTQNVHSDRHGRVEYGGVHKPIHTSVQYGFERTEDLIAAFQDPQNGIFSYARQGSPTSAALEAKITRLEDGIGTICFASGMGAIAGILLSMVRSGDHVISSQYVFGNTYSLLNTIAGLGVEVSKVDAGSASAVEAELKPNTRLVFVETIANPCTQVADLSGIGQLCRERGIVFVVDNTVTSPVLFQPKQVGASLIVNSLTKSIGGHGAALGGAVTDTGRFDWSTYPNIFEGYRNGDPTQWALRQIRRKSLRDMGGTLSAEQAHMISVGAETLEFRMSRASSTALALAEWLQDQPQVAAVHYPDLPSHPDHSRATQLFDASSWLLSFELKDDQAMVPFLDRLRLPIKATGLGDTRTLIIPVASTIFWEAGPIARKAMGIADGLIRLSVGLEKPESLIQDFDRAFG